MSMDIKPIVLYFKEKLSNEIKARNIRVTEGVIDRLISEDKLIDAGRLSTKELREIKRNLLASFDITQGQGHTIKTDCEPWLAKRKPDIDFYYWNRLRDYMLATDALPPNVISTLDTISDDILDCAGNPADESCWAQRGMVIGHVQSGKTTNYSAVITKAADSGYKIIILLAGITNSLRSQTQQRLDTYFIGRKSIFQAAAEEPLEILRFCEEKRDPAYGTSREQDFNKQSATTNGVSLASLAEPMIFITKKNKSTLENLNNWIKDQHHGKKIDYPLLLIDDEADNASINTHKDPKRSTTINTLIREIMDNFSRSTYIGYTATPFANIFIEPDSTQDMEQEDIFPRNFIKALEAPTNYSGANRIFSEDGDLLESTVRVVDDYADILPMKHRKDDDLVELPPSLYTAIRVFLLARAIRYIRGHKYKHCSMMINVSRFNNMQARVEGLVYEYLQELKAAIAVSARAEDALQDPLISDFNSDFLREFKDIKEVTDEDMGFNDVLVVLHKSTATVNVKTVNMRGGKLDYEKHKESGLHVIANGGLALSRGLTLDGLMVTYILRNVAASDTLMQMARWFGYHVDYEDLCRIYLPQASLDHYQYASIAIEELCSEVFRMEQSGLTPYQFGLKVRQSTTGIRITAANKMRSASVLKLAQDYSGHHVEAHAIFNDKIKNDEHIKSTVEFFEEIGEHSIDATEEFRYPFWTDVQGAKVASLIEMFHFPELTVDFARISGSRSLLLDYISDRLTSELSEWDVAIVGPRKKSSLMQFTSLIPGLGLLSRRRAKGDIIKNVFRATGSKNKVADPHDARIGLSKTEIEHAEDQATKFNIKGDRKYCLVRKRPLLIVHLFGVEKDAAPNNYNLGEHCLSLSVCLPSTQVRVEERTYQVNEIFRRALTKPLDDEADEDEDILMELQ